MSIADMIAAQGNRGPSFLERYEQMDQFKRRREMRGMLEGGSSPMELARAGYLQQAQQLQGLAPKQQKGPDLWELALRASKGDVDKAIVRVDKWKEKSPGQNININVPRQLSVATVNQLAESLPEATGMPELADLDPQEKIAVSANLSQAAEALMQQNKGMGQDEAFRMAVAKFKESGNVKESPWFQLPEWAQRAQGLVPTGTTYTPSGPSSTAPAATGAINRQNVDSSIPQGDIDLLLQGAGTPEQFDSLYGEGSAAAIMGSR